MTAQPTTKIRGLVAQDTEKPSVLLTVEQFLALYPGDEPYELLEGVVIEVPSPEPKHSAVDSRIKAQLQIFVDSHQLGNVITNSGFRLSDETIIVPDAAIVSKEKLDTVDGKNGVYPFAPDLAIEIVAPINSANEMQAKFSSYFAAGTQELWRVHLTTQSVVIYRANGTWQTVKAEGVVDDGTLLTGFSMPVAAMFPPDQPNDAVKP
jgi:Uma2 family endonuclease